MIIEWLALSKVQLLDLLPELNSKRLEGMSIIY